MLEVYLDLLDLGYYEVREAFGDLADAHVWKRPAEGLLSVGELAGHLAYWDVVKFAGDGGQDKPDLANCRVKSLLVDERFGYLPATLESSPSAEHFAMTGAQVLGELLRVHEESMACLKALNPDLDSAGPSYPFPSTYRQLLKYAMFHISYHTGQMYSARHLLGETTPDN